MGRRGRRTKEMVDTARRRMEILMGCARSEARQGDLDMAHTCVDHAIRIGMRYNLRLNEIAKDEYCRKCRSYLIPGRNVRVRLTSGKRTRTCLECGNVCRNTYSVVETRSGGDDHLN